MSTTSHDFLPIDAPGDVTGGAADQESRPQVVLTDPAAQAKAAYALCMWSVGQTFGRSLTIGLEDAIAKYCGPTPKQ
jgi:hypothetical protein